MVICFGLLLHHCCPLILEYTNQNYGETSKLAYISSKESDRDLESSKQDIIHPVGINESDKCERSNGR